MISRCGGRQRYGLVARQNARRRAIVQVVDGPYGTSILIRSFTQDE